MRWSILVIAGLALLYGAAHANADISDGLAAYYPFNGNANDQSGNGNNGVVYGATPTADRFGNANSAYSFDGTDDYVRIAESDSLNITGDLTISAWIRTGTGGQIVLSNMMETTPHSGYSLRLTSDGDLYFMSGDETLMGQTNVTTNSWTHVAVTLSGTTATSYVDGVFDASGTVGIPMGSYLDTTIGASSDPYYFWDGSIDDVRVYNRALSASEIGELHSIPEPSTLLLLGIGAVSLLAYGWRRRK